MSVINHLSNPSFYASLSLPANEGVSASPVAVSAENGISKNNLSPFVQDPIANRMADQADAKQLQYADALVADAYNQARGGLLKSGLGNYLSAWFEMLQVYLMREMVAKDLDARHPPEFIRGGLAGNVGNISVGNVSVGGDAMPGAIAVGFGTEIERADREEHQGFNLIMSSNPTDQSNGSTDLSTGSGTFQQLEAYLRG
jgi:hypothetical protein